MNLNDPKEIVKILKKSDEKYHNEGQWLLTDIEYDELKDRLKELSPNNSYFKKIGYNPPEKFKVKLPYFLGSQDKIKYNEIKELEKWFDTYNSPKSYVITEKLDGISCLIINNNNEIKIYTRGNGKEGIDISNIYTYIHSFPKEIPEGIAVRGELVISKDNWEKIKETGTNPRNVVAGIINRKIIDKKILPLIDFIAYDLLNDRSLKIEEALIYMKSLGFKVVKHLVLNKKIENEELFIILKDLKKTSNYEIDGIVITHNKPYVITNDKNPKYSFAFKSNIILEEIEVEVIDVIWNVSKDKYLKPVVKFNPIIINGITIKQATGFNADFIVKNKIGKGAIIKIQRSGDVIPHITGVIKKANEPLMPPNDISYYWNDTKIDIILNTNEKNKEQDIKIFAFFMKSLNIKGISEGIIKKLYESKYDTLKKIIHIKKEELLSIEGFKEKSSENLLLSLKEIHNKSCNEIMVASNIIGRGIGNKKIELIINEFPFICDNKKKALELTIEDIKKIKGMGDITSKMFIENLKNFYDFYEDLHLNKKEPEMKIEMKEEKNKKIENKHFVFTGFRNKDFESYINMNKGHIDNTITKNTNFLVVKDKTKITNKITNAIEKGIEILTIEDFENLMKS